MVSEPEESERSRARAKVDHWAGRKLWQEQVIEAQLARTGREAAASTVGLLPSSSLGARGWGGVGKVNQNPGVGRLEHSGGESPGKQLKGEPVWMAGHILERKSFVAVEHGQSLCRG